MPHPHFAGVHFLVAARGGLPYAVHVKYHFYLKLAGRVEMRSYPAIFLTGLTPALPRGVPAQIVPLFHPDTSAEHMIAGQAVG